MTSIKVFLCGQPVSQPVQSGFQALTEALKQRHIQFSQIENFTVDNQPGIKTLLIGTVNDYLVRISLQGNGVTLPGEPESLGFYPCASRDGDFLLLAGADDIGLMYLLYDVARKILARGAEALLSQTSYTESPENTVRCMDRYLVGHLDNEWFMSDDFNNYYFRRLACNRFNRFNLILGFDTAYMSPPYPFFVEVPGFESVQLSANVNTSREDNLAALRAMVDSCHKHGLKFVLATWQQRPWTTQQDSLVDNLLITEEGLSDYCYAGILALLKAVPGIDIVQFRVNHESGVGTQVSAEDFWKRCIDAVAQAKEETGKNFTLDLRAKGLTEEMVDHAYARGLDVEVPTKYWCEHAALPYHLSIMRSEELAQLDNFNHSRRYSYADMLRKPKKYDVIFRLWNYGSTNLFLWGDADYARRFSKSCTLSGAAGYQVNAPLSLKYGHELSHKNPWKVFRDEAYNQNRWEDERFWLWYVLFGRLGYNSSCPPEVWEDEFTLRFGKETGGLFREALATSSKIIPLITTVHMPVHPSLRYWTEMNTGWALFAQNNLNRIENYDFYSEITYGSTEPSDHGLFYGIDEYAHDISAGNSMQGKYTPLQYANWLEDLSGTTLKMVKSLRAADGKNPELSAGCLDMEMTAYLGAYHAWKIRAAYHLAIFKEIGDTQQLLESRQTFRAALSFWEKLSALGAQTYYHDLDFSSAGSTTRRGTWGDLTVELERDMDSLGSLLKENGLVECSNKAVSSIHRKDEVLPLYAWIPDTAVEGKEILIRAAAAGIRAETICPTLHYRHVNQLAGTFKTIPMHKHQGEYQASIPADQVRYEWDLMVYITVQPPEHACSMFPGVYHPEYPYPYAVITTQKGR